MAWIRSQNQEMLLNAEFIYYSNRLSKHRIVGDAVIIGTFPTKEAALAELDCIERWISTATADVYQVAKP